MKNGETIKCRICLSQLEKIGEFGEDVMFCEKCNEFKCPKCGHNEFKYNDYDGMIEITCKLCAFSWFKEEDLS
jgi:hypothetical protein